MTFLAYAVGLSALATVAAACFADQPSPRRETGLPISDTGSTVNDFDFFVGRWIVHHRRLKERLAGSAQWEEFSGTSVMHKLMDSQGNVDDNVIDLPSGRYRAVSLRAFDPKTKLWAIWWVDGRDPHHDPGPPVVGSFSRGIGTFYADDSFNGRPIRVRYSWSDITATSCRWQQAFSPDGGKTWETNWIMDFTRVR